MAENQEFAQKTYVSSQTNPYARVNEEMAAAATMVHHRRRRMKCFVFLLTFFVTLACISLILGLVFIKVRTPKLRVRKASFDTLEVATSNTNSSFHVRMVAELDVKNSNFGWFKYQNSTIEFYYMGAYMVGEAYVPKARVGARSTRRFDIMVELSSINKVPAEVVWNEFGKGPVIALTSRSSLRGKVNVMRIAKRNKASHMDCLMEINYSNKRIERLSC